MIAEIGAAFGAVELADALLQRLRHAPQLGPEYVLLAQHDLAEPAAAHPQSAHRRVCPVDDKDPHLCLIEETRAQFFLGDRRAVEDPFDVEIVDAEARIIGDGRARIAGTRLVEIAFERQIAVVVGEEEFPAVDTRDTPASGERRHRPGEVRREGCRGRFHGRISTMGICGQTPRS